MPLFYLGFGLFWLVTAIEAKTSYLRLGADALEFRENFKSAAFSKTQIEKVTWEAGCGVSMLLISGDWIRVPTFFENNQGITNSIRAWLNKR